jgi:hypothetical protein
MSGMRAFTSLALVLGATVLGIVGTGLIFTAVSDGKFSALVVGLPLALCGLYWCSRALAQSQHDARQRRARRRIAAQRG